MEGVFNILISSNVRQHLSLHGDRSAWQRRITIVRYDQPYEGECIFEIDKVLIKHEGPGILNWSLAGLGLLFQDYERTGGIVLTKTQENRTEDLLNESESLALFIRTRVTLAASANDSKGSNGDRPSITNEEFLDAYDRFCSDKSWSPLPSKIIEERLTDLMAHYFQVRKSHSLVRDGKAKRGWWNVEFIPEQSTRF